MKLEYEGTDITKDVSVAFAWHEMYAQGRSDELLLKLNDTRQLWDAWNPKKGDKIKVSDAAATTGEMTVDAVDPQSSLITIRALAMPPDATRAARSKSWEDVKFTQLVQEICDRYGLSYEGYGVEDQTYSRVEQNIPDFEFLARRCALEGYGFLAYDNKIVVYSGEYMDSQAAEGKMEITLGMRYEFSADDDARYGSCRVTDGSYTGTYKIGDGKEKYIILSERMSDQAEADRFAKGLLRYHNKDTRSMWLDSETFIRSYAAGSITEIEAEAKSSWNGKAFIERMRHDYVRRRSKIWARQCLEGY